MKKIKILLLVSSIVLSGSLFAQDKMDYLLSEEFELSRISGFGSCMIEISTINGELSASEGGGGAVLLDNKLFIGGYGMNSITSIDFTPNYFAQISSIQYPVLSARFNHGGLWLGYLHHSHDMIHFGINTKLGWGSINIEDDTYTYPNDFHSISDNVFIVNPGLLVEVNMTKWFKVGLDIGYRYVSGIDKNNINLQIEGQANQNIQLFEKNDYNGITGMLNLTFGWFERR